MPSSSVHDIGSHHARAVVVVEAFEISDDSSIASSRPGSPSPIISLVHDDRDGPLTDLDYDHCNNNDKMVHAALKIAKRGDEQLGAAQVQEAELEPVPGLLSGRRKPLSSSPLADGSASHVTGRINDAEIVAVNGASAALESQSEDASTATPNLSSAPKTPRTNPIDSTNLLRHDSHLHNSHPPTRIQPRSVSDTAQALLVDTQHVRPSLNMTAPEFSEAKTIILDLLGWGVPPEYIMRCGLGREAIYYAFTELNLRLPRDFDSNGIIPYEPPPNYLPPPVPP